MAPSWRCKNGHSKPRQAMNIKKLSRTTAVLTLLLGCLALYGCSANVGVGLNVSFPIGDHGYISLGSGNWF